MPRSTLGKWLLIGNVAFDPLALIEKQNFEAASQILFEWYMIRFLQNIGREYKKILTLLVDNSSGQHGAPALRGYKVKVQKTKSRFIVYVDPSPIHKRRGLDVFQLLDKGNKPTTGNRIFPQNRSPLSVPWIGDRETGHSPTPMTSGRSGSIFIGSGESPTGVQFFGSVAPYKGRNFSQRIIKSQVSHSNIVSELFELIFHDTLQQVDRRLRDSFKKAFGITFISTVSRNKRQEAYTLIAMDPEGWRRSLINVSAIVNAIEFQNRIT